MAMIRQHFEPHWSDLAVIGGAGVAGVYLDRDHATLTRLANEASRGLVKGQSSTFEVEGAAFAATVAHGHLVVERAR